jgi:DNA-binding XRE family transcriptional regulator
MPTRSTRAPRAPRAARPAANGTATVAEPTEASLAEFPEVRDDQPMLRRGVGRAPRPIPLKTVREATGKTQVEVAEATGWAQGDVSSIERRDDHKLSTLARYAKALGLTLEVSFVMPQGQRLRLKVDE